MAKVLGWWGRIRPQNPKGIAFWLGVGLGLLLILARWIMGY